ncbi:MAG: SusC/RagA family TonB-linked outer membrane protein, partial [Muribaculaceae bacterium]|nr:SusC/RagA family TonB-linked outer membrane protein [Muribaculaceae bacterium]
FMTSDRGWQKVLVDYYMPQGALVNVDGMNDDGTYINPVYQTETHYGTWPYPNSTVENGAGSSISPVGNWDEAKKNVDPSFVKVKNITLGYTFNKSVLNNIGCKQARIYFTVTNPFVFTKYLGFDPEWATASLKNDGPSTVTYQIGASIKF